jgi:AraC-like DNA-binding protein
LDNAFLAKRLYLSEAQFYRSVKDVYKESPNQLIRKRRLCRAQEYLTRSSAITVKDAAYEVGFSHVGYFIRRYKEMFGSSPGERQRSRSC